VSIFKLKTIYAVYLGNLSGWKLVAVGIKNMGGRIILVAVRNGGKKVVFESQFHFCGW
jgi:hypothetical protein